MPGGIVKPAPIESLELLLDLIILAREWMNDGNPEPIADGWELSDKEVLQEEPDLPRMRIHDGSKKGARGMDLPELLARYRSEGEVIDQE